MNCNFRQILRQRATIRILPYLRNFQPIRLLLVRDGRRSTSRHAVFRLGSAIFVNIAVRYIVTARHAVFRYEVIVRTARVVSFRQRTCLRVRHLPTVALRKRQRFIKLVVNNVAHLALQGNCDGILRRCHRFAVGILPDFFNLDLSGLVFDLQNIRRLSG